MVAQFPAKFRIIFHDQQPHTVTPFEDKLSPGYLKELYLNGTPSVNIDNASL